MPDAASTSHLEEMTMNHYDVTVRTPAGTIAYTAVGSNSFDVALAAIELYGVCGVCVVPQ